MKVEEGRLHILPKEYFDQDVQRWYDAKADIDQIWYTKDPEKRDANLIKYFGISKTIIARIKPELNPRDTLVVDDIRQFYNHYGITYGIRPEDGIQEIDKFHDVMASILNRYGFDRILLKKLTVG
jgi:hypothetical protein